MRAIEQNCLYRGNFNEIVAPDVRKIYTESTFSRCLFYFIYYFRKCERERGKNAWKNKSGEEKKFAIFAEIFRISAAERINCYVRCNTMNLSAQNIRCRHEYLLVGRSVETEIRNKLGVSVPRYYSTPRSKYLRHSSCTRARNG